MIGGPKQLYLRFRQPVGPTSHAAGLGLSYEPSPQFEFRCEANWPDGTNYSGEIEDSIRTTLSELSSKPIGGRFTVTELDCHDVYSSGHAFSFAARQVVMAMHELSRSSRGDSNGSMP